MKINQIMSRPVGLIDPTTTIAAAAGKMRDEDVGCLLVARDDRLLGIVTDRDIAVRALADGRNAIREPVWTVMSNNVLCCSEDQPVEEAARIMAEHSGRRLPGRRRHQINAFPASAQAAVRAKRRSCGMAAAVRGYSRSALLCRRGQISI